MSDALLATKLSVPRGPKAAVLRERLLDRLDTGVDGPVTLVAAPAGAGKSALLSSWIAEGRPEGPGAAHEHPGILTEAARVGQIPMGNVGSLSAGWRRRSSVPRG